MRALALSTESAVAGAGDELGWADAPTADSLDASAPEGSGEAAGLGWPFPFSGPFEPDCGKPLPEPPNAPPPLQAAKAKAASSVTHAQFNFR
ncbi:MAG: hypothetical protein M3T49_10230 [Candidatus Eremiobacteraeota bacterium]|nr:hypothetical protein [Candidatus Eremiobacteraeota bacterium]